jgi:hypothetical protein
VKQYSRYAIILVAILALMALTLSGCGGEPQPTPTATRPPATNTPVPTQAPPTNTPEPTLDPASLPVTELQATAEWLEAELAIQERNLGSASGAEGATIQGTVDKLKRQLREVLALIEAAGAGEADESATEPTATPGS